MTALLLFVPTGLVLVSRRWAWAPKTKNALTAVVALAVIIGSAASCTAPGAQSPSRRSPSSEIPATSPEPTASATATPTFEPYTPEPADAIPVEYVTVRRVIDGDTIEVAMSNGSTERVRFIGVDSPESSAALGPAATAYAKNVLPAGRGIYLQTDVEPRDRYGRLLAYAWLSKPAVIDDEEFIRARMVNALLLLKGWAQLLTITPNVSYVDSFTTFQTEARDAGLGIWKPAAVKPPAKQKPSTGDGGGNCDPSYPDVCIPSPPPDLDCDDVPYDNIRVVGDDPHGFDGNDNDGIGCES